MMDMLDIFICLWNFRRNRFAHVLAKADAHSCASNSLELWSYYRLKMYAAIVERTRTDRHWRGLFAKAVAFAACGRLGEAEVEAREFLRRADCRPHREALAGALAPFMPELAIQMLDNPSASVSLRAALLLRTAAFSEARAVLKEAFAKGEQRRFPELHLYRSNTERGAPAQQLIRLNAFLQAYQLPQLSLCDAGLPPSPLNVQAPAPIKTIDGPLVSVLMTTYQTGRWADMAIGAVLGQSYRNIELIIIDDASDDETPDIVRAWATRDHRVKYLRLGCNGGTYLAKNIGLHHARGTFVTCHDSDDWSHPLKIERQVRPLLEDSRLIATVSYWVRMQDDGIFYARQVHPLMRMNSSSLLFRKDKVLKRAGAWDRVRTGADSEFLARLRLVFGDAAIRRVVQPLALAAHRPDSLMTADATGYSDSGISSQRQAYWEAWSRWHIDALRMRYQPRMPFDIERIEAERPFAVPREIALRASDAAACMASIECFPQE
ncbi:MULTISPECIES: glycosyltransferase family 2 protein [Cupriavidus]